MSNLALTLRPESLDQVLGNAQTVKALKSFADRNYFPNVFLFYGPPGTGKTTLAQIVARAAGGHDESIHNINGSVQNKVEDARSLSEDAFSVPFSGGRRVFVLNEFHRWTDAAQDAIKDTMEVAPAMWVLTTDAPDKISSAIRSRASAATFELKPLNRGEIADLVRRAVPSLDCSQGIADFLSEKGITSPREILGILDQHLAGVPLEQCVHGAEHDPLYKDVASAVLSGNWTKTATLLSQIKTADYRGMVSMVSAYFGNALLKEPVGARADALSTCLVGLGNSNYADGVAYAATKGLLYKAAKAMSVR